MTKILICGSRKYSRLDRVRKCVRNFNEDIKLIVGDAKGVDKTAYQAAKDSGRKVKVFRANWDKLGRKAGMVRNLEMLDEMPRLIIAFWDGESPGTKFMIQTALKRRMNLNIRFEF